MGKFLGVASARRARILAVGVTASALLLGGAGVAMAEADSPAGDTVDITVPATTETPAAPVPDDVDEGPDTGEETGQETTPPQDPALGAPEENAQTNGERSTAAAKRSAVAPDTPGLRWQLVDASGDAVSGATVAVQGPRDPAVADAEHGDPWGKAPASAVEDNVGQPDYDGVDLDAAPGSFHVQEITTAAGKTPLVIGADADYRIRASAAEGFTVGEEADWTVLAASSDADAAITQVTLVSQTATEEIPARQTAEVSPMAFGPDGATPPYVYWTVEDANGDLVGGAAFNVQGPRDNGFLFPSWSENGATIVDNGPEDLDKDDGEFLVKQFDGHDIRSDRRYRIQQADAPTDYRFTGSGDWRSIDGNRRIPDASEWTGDVHDFGTFDVEQLPATAPICTAGNIYGISSTGRLQHVSPSGTVTPIGSLASPSSGDMNGLGIGAGGQTVYAMQRTDGATDATVWEYDVATGNWANTGHKQETSVGLVAGAVNLDTGDYVFGGFTSTGSQFHIWKYVPASGTFSKVGYINTNMSSSSNNNGDMAFNAAGDAFVVLGRGNDVTVFSITAANFNAGSGGLINSAKSEEFQTSSSDVNGIAFDAAGKAYLGNASQMRSYDMPNWDNANLVTSGLSSSTDLASCSSPATIMLQKRLVGDRANPGDQFRLTLSQNGQPLGTATTAGSASGIQPQVVGPLPVVRNATLTFNESFVNGAQAANYATTYQCLVDGEPMNPAVSGTGTTGAVTVPAIGEQIVCEFVNTPLTATVTINKAVREFGQDTPEAASGWTVNAVPTPTIGEVTRSPNASQQTDQAGQADWTLNFSTPLSRATVNVSETQQPGYEFESGQCTITRSVGDPIEVELDSEAATALTGVGPGDQVDCTYVNRQIPGAIHWEKITDDDPAEHIGGSTWTVKGPGPNGPTITVEDCIGDAAADCAAATDKDHRAGYLRVVDLAWGTYTITETQAPDGFELGDVTTWQVTITAGNAEAGATIDPVVNARLVGSATWSKVATGTGELLGGSEWTLTGPGTTTNETVVDCVESDATACTGLDKDPAAGVFLLEDLAWGDYTLVESSAPLGYILDTTEHTFTVDASTTDAVIDLGEIENSLATPPTLPLTGGLGADFYKFAGIGILLIGALLYLARRFWTAASRAQ